MRILPRIRTNDYRFCHDDEKERQTRWKVSLTHTNSYFLLIIPNRVLLCLLFASRQWQVPKECHTINLRDWIFKPKPPRLFEAARIGSTFRERRRLFHQRSRHRMYRTYRRGAYHGPTFLLVCGRIFWTLGYRYESFSLFIVSRRKKQSKNLETLFKCICSANFAEETGCVPSFRDRSSRRHQKKGKTLFSRYRPPVLHA